MYEREYITVKEFALKVRYNERQIRRCIESGEIKASRAGRRRKWLIHISEVERFRGGKAPDSSLIEEVKNIKNEPAGIYHEEEKGHFQQLSHVAKTILGGIGHIQRLGNRYRFYGPEEIPGSILKTLTRTQLVDLLQCQLISAYNENSTLCKCFYAHLRAENSKCEDMFEYAESSPEELFKFLQLVALRKTFKGKCDICKDW
jgi:excisionase family DNA binding protein